jgi:hypothetical protein
MSTAFVPHDQPLKLAVVASAAITRDQALSRRASGFVGPLVAGEPFVGFADEDLDAQSSNGDAFVRTRMKGRVEVAIAGVAQTNLGDAVYASDPSTFTLTSSSNSLVGRIVSVPATGTCIVEFADVGD